MNIVMNIQQWKDINNWRKHICSHAECNIKNQLGDWTKPAMGQRLTCRELHLLRLELSDHMKWVGDQARVDTCQPLLFYFVYIVKKHCRSFDNFNARLPRVWMEKAKTMDFLKSFIR